MAIIEMACSMLHSKKMKVSFWGETIVCATHIINQTPTHFFYMYDSSYYSWHTSVDHASSHYDADPLLDVSRHVLMDISPSQYGIALLSTSKRASPSTSIAFVKTVEAVENLLITHPVPYSYNSLHLYRMFPRTLFHWMSRLVIALLH